MPRKLVRLRERNQITLPDTVVEKFKLEPGDFLEFSFDQGRVEVRPARIAKAGTPEAAEAEARAVADLEQGRFSTFDTVPELMQHLKDRAAEVVESAGPEHLPAPVEETTGRRRRVYGGKARAAAATQLIRQEAEKLLRRAAEQAAYENKYEGR